MMKNHRPFNTLPLPQQAGILCNTPEFQKFTALRSGFPGQQFSRSASAEFLRQWCRVDSRSEITTGSKAEKQFGILLTEYDAWRGRIAPQQ